MNNNIKNGGIARHCATGGTTLELGLLQVQVTLFVLKEKIGLESDIYKDRQSSL